MLRSLISLIVIVCAGSAMATTNELVFKNGFERPIWVSGYHVGYQNGELPIDQVNFDDITHLMVGAIVPNTDGTLSQTFFIDSVNGPTWAHSAVDAAHAHARKAILMIGGAGAIAGWQSAASSAHRATFVSNLLAAVSTYGADGLDLDWEPIASIDHADLIALVQALRTNGPPGLLLTMPVAPININFPPSGEGPLFTTLYPLLDQLSVMSYGMAYDYSGWYSWFSSALAGEAGNYPTSVASSVNYYLGLGVPAAKLGVGIGFYGECFHNVTTPRTAVASGDLVNADDNTMTYAHIATAYVPNMTYHYDVAANAPWLSHTPAVGPEGCTYITYEDAASIAAKGAYVLSNGLGGTIIWTIGEGHVGPGNDPVLDAVGAAFLGL